MTFGLFFVKFRNKLADNRKLMEEKFLKITNAVYGILAFFPESDPLKNRAKEKVLAIMENLTLFSSRQISIDSLKYSLFEDIAILLNYLKIGESQGWINSVNYLIISNGYEKIKKEIGLPSGIGQKMPESLQTAQESIYSRQEPASTKEDIDFSVRQNKIIKFLEEKGKAQVMDLKAVLPDITKRTIRRDIDDLLEKGIITRQGEFNQVFYKINR